MARGGSRSGAGRPKGVLKGQGKGRQKQSPPEREFPPREPRPDRPADDAPRATKAIPIKGEIVTATPWLVPDDTEPRDFLLALMRDPQLPLGFRRQAAVDALPYCHGKVGELGKKAQAQLDAEDPERNGGWGDLLN